MFMRLDSTIPLGLRPTRESVLCRRGRSFGASMNQAASDVTGRRPSGPLQVEHEEDLEPTLAEAIELHLRAMRAKGCAPGSMTALQEACARHLGLWMERPLSSLRRHEVATRHEDLTDSSGPYCANSVMAHFRAVYNTAVRRFVDLPATNPVLAVTFNTVKRRRQPVPWEELPDWYRRVQALRNPVRRDLQLLLLFTGLRSLDARTIRHEHVDFEAGTLHRPKPKGGEDRAFTIPVSRFVLEVLQRRFRKNEEDDGWVFPSRNSNGRVTHVHNLQEERVVDGRRVSYLPTPHRLRDTFATAAHEAQVHPLDLKVLMNHALPAGNDVTLGYIRPSVEHLRVSVEQIAAFLEERLRAAMDEPSAEVVKPQGEVDTERVDSPLETLFGNRSAALLMLYLLHYGEVYPTGAARDLDLSLSPVQRQLEKFEAAGFLVSKLLGRTRIYSFDPKHPATAKLEELVRVFYEAMTLKDREKLFGVRRRPRRRGKPVRG
jgi:integrase